MSIDELVAEGLHPGMRVQVLDSTPERLRFVADAEEHVLAPVLAANLSVIVLTQEEEMTGPFERLSSLELGESAKVVSISPFLRPQERRRMLDLGLIQKPGTEKPLFFQREMDGLVTPVHVFSPLIQ